MKPHRETTLILGPMRLQSFSWLQAIAPVEAPRAKLKLRIRSIRLIDQVAIPLQDVSPGRTRPPQKL